MGPDIPLKSFADVIKWAQRFLGSLANSIGWAQLFSVNNIGWAQICRQNPLPMSDGPVQ
jgi:hypothetical protein